MAGKAVEFPEVLEAAASPAIRAIYGEIRRFSGVPMVVLIFRHLATYPGVLEEVWGALRPLFVAGALQEAAWAAAAQSTRTDLVPPIGEALRPALSLDAPRLVAVGDVLDAYNRANPVNLAACACLLARLRAPEAPTRALTARDGTPPVPIERPLSPMIAPADIAPDLRALIGELGFGAPGQGGAVVPSLFRHISDLPAFLVVLHDALMPRIADGAFPAAVDAVRDALTNVGEALACHLPPLPRMAATPAAAAAIERFAGGVIPQMVVIGYGLRLALGEAGAAHQAGR